VTARERLEAVLAPDLLSAIEELVDERFDERLRSLSAKRLNGRNRPEFLTVPEAAELLRADRQRVYDLCSSGRLTRHKDGSRTLIRRAELEAHLAAGRESEGRA
jgi:excisionase family DNA binding protein